MNFVKVVQSGTKEGFEKGINGMLDQYNEAKLVDIKVTGAYDGKSDYYMAVIIFSN
jgi:hypothetical protein